MSPPGPAACSACGTSYEVPMVDAARPMPESPATNLPGRPRDEACSPRSASPPPEAEAGRRPERDPAKTLD